MSTRRLMLALTVCIAGLTGAARSQSGDVTAFVDVNVIPMDRARVLQRHTVIVRDGIIVNVGPVASIEVPEDVRRIEGGGKAFLLPGLADMHSHVSEAEDLALYTANGVTTILHMGKAPTGLVTHANKVIDAGAVIGPHIFFALMVDSSPEYGSWFASSAEQARALVQLAKANGYDFIKHYSGVTPDVFAALVDEGRKLGIANIGHGGGQSGFRKGLKKVR